MSSQCIIYTVMCSPYWTQNFGSSLWILDSSKILPILSENRDFFSLEIKVSDSLFLESADFLDVRNGNFSGSWTHGKFGMVSHRNPRLRTSFL
ncbi:unnamed protein product [Rhizophagus irregularis]|nr:unnamed protein product [Rhizophagus irregularis]